MTPIIKPWLSQQDAQRLFCELADANLDAAQRKRERDILQHALDEATARIVELLNERDQAAAHRERGRQDQPRDKSTRPQS